MVTDNPRGEVYCASCGFVVKENVIETGPEWRSFSNEEKDERSRTGLPTSVAIHDMGLATDHRERRTRTPREGRSATR